MTSALNELISSTRNDDKKSTIDFLSTNDDLSIVVDSMITLIISILKTTTTKNCVDFKSLLLIMTLLIIIFLTNATKDFFKSIVKNFFDRFDFRCETTTTKNERVIAIKIEKMTTIKVERVTILCLTFS